MSSWISGWTVAGSGNRVLDASALFVEILRSSSSRARGRHPNFPADQSVSLMRTPSMLFAIYSVMASIFSVVGGPTIMSSGRSSMLALTLSQISEEREKGPMNGSRMESAFVA